MDNEPQTVKVTRYDMDEARQAMEKHRAKHKCRTGQGCPEYVRLIHARNEKALHWNEPLDNPVPTQAYL